MPNKYEKIRRLNWSKLLWTFDVKNYGWIWREKPSNLVHMLRVFRWENPISHLLPRLSIVYTRASHFQEEFSSVCSYSHFHFLCSDCRYLKDIWKLSFNPFSSTCWWGTTLNRRGRDEAGHESEEKGWLFHGVFLVASPKSIIHLSIPQEFFPSEKVLLISREPCWNSRILWSLTSYS